MMKGNLSRRRAPKVQLIDLVCLILTYLIIAQFVTIGIAFQLNFQPLSKIDRSIASFNRVVYLLQGSVGSFSGALTPEQVVARYQAVENDACSLTIHSILTTPVDPAGMILPSANASRASESFWQTESFALRHRNAAAG